VAALVMAVCLAVAWPPAVDVTKAEQLASATGAVVAPARPNQLPESGDVENSPLAGQSSRPLADVRPILQGDVRQPSADAAFDPASVLEDFARGMERRLALSDAEEVLSEAEAVADVPVENDRVEAADAPRIAPPKAIDVAARLADPLPRLAVQEMPLVEYYRTLAEISAMPVSLDLDALALAGVSTRQPVSVNLEAATVAEALAAPVEQYGLAAAIAGHGVTITAAPGADSPAIARFPLDDLLAGGAPEDARQLVLRLVAPATWSEAGGPGTIRVEGDELVVEHTAAPRRETERFLEMLRLARRSPPGSAAVTPLARRWQLAGDRLSAPLTANYVEPTRLSRISAHVEAKTGLTICIDWTSLAEQGIGAEAAATFHATDTPVWEALASLLAPLGLSVRIVDERTLEIVAACVEFYPFRPIAEDASVLALLKRIETEISPESWQAAGGRGTLYFDAPSGFLLVRQSSVVHVALERLLETLPPAAAP